MSETRIPTKKSRNGLSRLYFVANARGCDQVHTPEANDVRWCKSPSLRLTAHYSAWAR